MDSEGFVKAVEERFVPIAPIIEFAIKKQLAEVGADRKTLTAEQAVKFIDKMVGALDLFLGPTQAKDSKQIMMKDLRKYAPEYFESLT